MVPPPNGAALRGTGATACHSDPVFRSWSEMREEPEWRTPFRIEVDGEQFDVSASRDRPGHYRFDWVSGRNAGYGFSAGSADGRSMRDSEIENAIRSFLAQVDPETGYIE